MKTLHSGYTSRLPKWVGLVMECPQCGRVDELERGDEALARLAITPKEVMLTCQTCFTQHGKAYL